MRINGQKVREGVKAFGEVVGCGLLILASCIKLKNDGMGPVGYDDAVEAIMDSSMLSSHKCEAAKWIKQGMSNEYYRSIISVVKSNMLGSNKIDAIKHLSEK